MRLGVMGNPPHVNAFEWAEKMSKMGIRSVVLPCGSEAPDRKIDSYTAACKDFDLTIAEVGAWCNPMDPDQEKRKKNREYCTRQLQFADYVEARCCVNICGSLGNSGPWDGPALQNYGREAFQRVVETTREILDTAKPEKTFYTLEPMPWMIPDSPEQYLDLIHAVDRKQFAVHMDVVNMLYSPRDYFLNHDFLDRCFQKLGRYTRSCHVKDIKIEGKLTLHLSEVPCGEGNMDLKHYAELATATDPDMPFLLEHLSSWEAYEDALRKVQIMIG